MLKLITLLVLLPVISIAQKTVPRFENDTLYTTSGYKIYAGLTLHLAKGTGYNGNFRFIKAKTPNGTSSFANTVFVVEKLKDYNISDLGNAYITVESSRLYGDGSKTKINIALVFDKAIEGLPGLPSELIVPDEFKAKQKSSAADEIAKFYELYQKGIITKEEFETQKRKLLNQ